MSARAHVIVRGQVQGVFFRAEMRDRAASLGLGGWVRNNPDGTVEAVFEGERERVESMVEWCRRGPRLARVEDADVTWEQPVGETRFTVNGGWT
jgi:acylphosphatase